MPRICRVVSYHVQSLLRNSTFVRHQHAIHVLVVPPREFQLIQAAIRLVHAVLGIVSIVVHVWIQCIVPRQYHGLVGYATAHDEGIPSQRPLLAVLGRFSILSVGQAVSILTDARIAPEEHDLAHVVYETYELEPIRMIRLAYTLGGLEQVEQIGLRFVFVFVLFVCFDDSRTSRPAPSPMIETLLFDMRYWG